ncbi:MAG: ABC transporter permease [Acetivibrionales bacterium]|jgi:hypothetical protein
MRNGKWFGVLSFAGCLLLFMAVFLSGSIYNKILDLNGHVSMSKVTICLKEDSRTGYFSQEDINNLKKLPGIGLISCTAQQTAIISQGNNFLAAGVAGTDELAPMFGDMPVTGGSFFSEADCREKSRVAVIDKDTAWKLFNNDNVIGCHVNIFGNRFKITGIIESDRSVIGKLTAGGTAKVYIPVSTFMEINSNAGISYVQCETDPETIIGKGADEMRIMLASIGKDPAGCIIKDYNAKGAVLAQKPDFLLFFMGLFIIFVLLSYNIKSFKKTMHNILKECKTDYISRIIGKYRHDIVKMPALIILTCLVSVIIWRMTRFSLFVPPGLIPDDPADISHYAGLILEKAGEALSGGAYTVPFQEAKSGAAEIIFNVIFYTGCFLGLLFFYTGLAGLKKTCREPGKMLLVFGGFIVADLLIFVLLAYLAGFPAVVGLKDIILYWAFIFTNLTLCLHDEQSHEKIGGKGKTPADNFVSDRL